MYPNPIHLSVSALCLCNPSPNKLKKQKQGKTEQNQAGSTLLLSCPWAGSPTSMPPGPVVVYYPGKDAGPALLSAAAVEGRGQLSCSTDLRPALWPNIGRLHGMRREGHLSCGHFTSWQMRGGATSTHTHEPLTWSPQPHGRLCCAT